MFADLWVTFQKGGYVMYPILACSVFSVALAAERGMTGVETQANIMLDSYNDHLVFLSMIVTISPLLGLLGTIIGMINSFKVFDLRAGQPFAITAGIGEALIATAFGLIVAILAMVLYGALKYRSSVLGKKIMKCCTALELHANGGETR